jgi:hypothetical protein
MRYLLFVVCIALAPHRHRVALWSWGNYLPRQYVPPRWLSRQAAVSTAAACWDQVGPIHKNLAVAQQFLWRDSEICYQQIWGQRKIVNITLQWSRRKIITMKLFNSIPCFTLHSISIILVIFLLPFVITKTWDQEFDNHNVLIQNFHVSLTYWQFFLY